MYKYKVCFLMRFVPKLPSLWHRLVCFVVTAATWGLGLESQQNFWSRQFMVYRLRRCHRLRMARPWVVARLLCVQEWLAWPKWCPFECWDVAQIGTPRSPVLGVRYWSCRPWLNLRLLFSTIALVRPQRVILLSSRIPGFPDLETGWSSANGHNNERIAQANALDLANKSPRVRSKCKPFSTLTILQHPSAIFWAAIFTHFARCLLPSSEALTTCPGFEQKCSLHPSFQYIVCLMQHDATIVFFWFLLHFVRYFFSFIYVLWSSFDIGIPGPFSTQVSEAGVQAGGIGMCHQHPSAVNFRHPRGHCPCAEFPQSSRLGDAILARFLHISSCTFLYMPVCYSCKRVTFRGLTSAWVALDGQADPDSRVGGVGRYWVMGFWVMAAMAAMACCEGAHDLGMALSNLQAMCCVEREKTMKMARFSTSIFLRCQFRMPFLLSPFLLGPAELEHWLEREPCRLGALYSLYSYDLVRSRTISCPHSFRWPGSAGARLLAQVG